MAGIAGVAPTAGGSDWRAARPGAMGRRSEVIGPTKEAEQTKLEVKPVAG
ncbi:MAG: hypothetical protein H0U67_13925 [Gemmatimonadetes bacterium]|nr:hypothetical protein [Gemmatimonadota bacterium]